jgi:NAD(P)H-dependent FMN reductase
MPRLLVIVASTRPGRAGGPVSEWFLELARREKSFDIEVADLAEMKLPFMDEPEHPSLRRYTHDHTRRWSATVDAADAFVFVMPEYNFGFSAPLKNALDYLYEEWRYKPVGFVSYGSIAGGTRAVQMIKQVVTTLSMMPVKDGVVIPWVAERIDADRRFRSDDSMERAAVRMLDEVGRLAKALSTMRV